MYIQPICFKDNFVSNTIEIRFCQLIVVKISILCGWNVPSSHEIFGKSL